MEWERIKEIVSDQYHVNAVGSGDFVNRVMPMYSKAVLAI